MKTNKERAGSLVTATESFLRATGAIGSDVVVAKIAVTATLESGAEFTVRVERDIVFS